MIIKILTPEKPLHFSVWHRKPSKTIIQLVIAMLLISVSLIIGTADNIPMIVMLLAGIIFLYFTILHPWNKAAYFAFLAAICLAILTADFIWPFISEDIAVMAGFICFAGIITGIVGIFIRMKNWNRLPFAGSLPSFFALGILTTSAIRSLKQVIASGYVWILVCIQLSIAILLLSFHIANVMQNELLIKVFQGQLNESSQISVLKSATDRIQIH